MVSDDQYLGIVLSTTQVLGTLFKAMIQAVIFFRFNMVVMTPVWSGLLEYSRIGWRGRLQYGKHSVVKA